MLITRFIIALSFAALISGCDSSTTASQSTQKTLPDTGLVNDTWYDIQLSDTTLPKTTSPFTSETNSQLNASFALYANELYVPSTNSRIQLQGDVGDADTYHYKSSTSDLSILDNFNNIPMQIEYTIRGEATDQEIKDTLNLPVVPFDVAGRGLIAERKVWNVNGTTEISTRILVNEEKFNKLVESVETK